MFWDEIKFDLRVTNLKVTDLSVVNFQTRLPLLVAVVWN